MNEEDGLKRIIEHLKTMPAVVWPAPYENAWTNLVAAYGDGNEPDSVWWEKAREVYESWMADSLAKEPADELQAWWECQTSEGREFLDELYEAEEGRSAEYPDPPPVSEMASGLARQYFWRELLWEAESQARKMIDWDLWAEFEYRLEQIPSRDGDDAFLSAWEHILELVEIGSEAAVEELQDGYSDLLHAFLEGKIDIEEKWFEWTDAGAEFTEAEEKAEIEGGEEPVMPDESEQLKEVAREFWGRVLADARKSVAKRGSKD